MFFDGEKVLLLSKSSFSGAAFSIPVTIIQTYKKKKFIHKMKQEIKIRIECTGEEIVVFINELFVGWRKRG